MGVEDQPVVVGGGSAGGAPISCVYPVGIGTDLNSHVPFNDSLDRNGRSPSEPNVSTGANGRGNDKRAAGATAACRTKIAG